MGPPIHLTAASFSASNTAHGVSAVVPGLVVFDLDDTLWIGDVDCTHGPPFSSKSTHQIITCRKRTPLPLHSDVPAILAHLVTLEIPIAIASRTTRPNWARQVLDLVTVGQSSRPLSALSVHSAWGDCSKISHFNEIHLHTNIPYSEMLFFDNELRNISDVLTLGVHCVYCPDGITIVVGII